MIWQERTSPKTTINVLKELIPTLYIMQSAMDKMQIIVEENTMEVGWLCLVEEQINQLRKSYIITDVMLFDQEVHQSTCELTADGLIEVGMDILNSPNGDELYNKIRGWGHSHVNMGVSPSGQDDKQMKLFGENGCDWFVRIVLNKKGEMHASIFNYSTTTSFEDIPWRIIPHEEVSVLEEEISNLYAKIDEVNLAKLETLRPTVKGEVTKKVRPFKTTPYSGGAYPRAKLYDAYDGYGYEPGNWSKKKEKKEMEIEEVLIAIGEREVLAIGMHDLIHQARTYISQLFPSSTYVEALEIYNLCKDYYNDYIEEKLLLGRDF